MDSRCHLRNDTDLDVDWTYEFPESWQLQRKYCGGADTKQAANHQRVWSTDAIGNGTGNESTKGRDSLDRHGIKAHHAAAFFILGDGLQDRVAGCHLLHEAPSSHHQ